MSRKNINVIIDTDVLVSGSLSKEGASYWLLEKITIGVIKKFTSQKQIKEYNDVLLRLGVKNILLFQTKFRVLELTKNNHDKAKDFVHDKNDAHIAALAIQSKASFLITYNIKDFKVDELKREFDLICITPGMFLQYLRSMGNKI